MTPPTPLRVDGLRVPLSSFTLAIDGLELSLGAAGIVGPSGAGKTTLLEVIAGLRRHRAGRVQLGDRVLADPARGVWVPPRERRVGCVPQHVGLFPHMTVRQNLLYGVRREPTRLSLGGVTETLEIGALLDRGVARLSGGEARRVAFARALLTEPDVLLLDEPLEGLDRPLRERIVAYIRRVRAEYAIPLLLVTHDAGDIASLCDQVVTIEQGTNVRRMPGAAASAVAESDRGV